MKKEEVIFIRILTVIALSVVMAFILFIFANGNMFQNIVNSINGNNVDINSKEASIYNLYFYKGLDVVYKNLFSVTLFGLILTSASLFIKRKGSGIFAVVSSGLAVITGFFIVICCILENNKTFHNIINGFYSIKVTSEDPADFLKFVWIAGLIIMIIGCIVIFIIKAGRIDKIKAFGNDQNSQLGIFIPVIMGSLFFETIRQIVVSAACNITNSYNQAAYLCIKDYYFAKEWFFNWPMVVFITAVMLGMIFLKDSRFKKVLVDKRTEGFIIPGIIMIVGIVRAVVYLMNPPALFGYLTVDEKMCDIIEASYPIYILLFLIDIVYLMITLKMLMEDSTNNLSVIIAYAITIVVSIILIFVLGYVLGLPGMYTGCIIGNIVGLIFCKKKKIKR